MAAVFHFKSEKKKFLLQTLIQMTREREQREGKKRKEMAVSDLIECDLQTHLLLLLLYSSFFF